VRLTLVINDLGAGGTERVLTLLANCWARRGHAVTVLTHSRDDPFFPLAPAVQHRRIGGVSASRTALSAIWANGTRVKRLRRAILHSSPDLVIGFALSTNVRVLLALLGTGVPVVVCERTEPRHLNVGLAWAVLRRLLYPRAFALTCLTPNVASFFEPLLGGRIHVIPNPVLAPCVGGDAPCSLPPGRRLMAVGRLRAVKRFDLLVEVFARISSRHPDWHLLIVGDGPMRPQLESMVARLHLRDRVHLLGLVPDTSPFLLASDMFVLTSSREGFPNALCEALACGLPAVTFDCPSGPGDIVRDGVDGLLVADGDREGLASALDRLMSDDLVRSRMAEQAPDVVRRFNLARVLSSWDEILSSVTKGGS